MQSLGGSRVASKEKAEKELAQTPRPQVGRRGSLTEGARATLNLYEFYRNALSLTRLRRELPPGGSLWIVQPEGYGLCPMPL